MADHNEHPLPWRYSDTFGPSTVRSPIYVGYLVDANGRPITSMGYVASPYARAVLERAGAMEQELRWLTTLLFEAKTLLDLMYPDHRTRLMIIRKLLAEIDAVKAGG